MRANELSALNLFIRSEVERGQLSTRELGKILDVSQATALRLISSPRVPREETLQKVAEAFDLPITEVRTMANRPSGVEAPLYWPAEFDQLNPRERDALLEIGWVMIEAHELGKVTR